MDGNIVPRNKERIQEDIERLKEWLSKQPHLPQEFDESWLLAFVTGTKSIEIAKQKLESFCMIRSKNNHLFIPPFRKPTDPGFREALQYSKIFILPEPIREGHRILVIILDRGVEKQTSTTFKFFSSRLAIIVELIMSIHPDTTVMECLLDSKNVDPGVMAKITLQEMIFLMQYMELCLPIKFNRFVAYNTPSFAEYFLTIFVRPYVKKKLYDRIIVTTKGEEVLKEYEIPEELLPTDMNGGKGSFTTDQLNEQWIKMVEDREDWLLKTASLCMDESKRPSDGTNSYGVDGTFRKLAFD